MANTNVLLQTMVHVSEGLRGEALVRRGTAICGPRLPLSAAPRMASAVFNRHCTRPRLLAIGGIDQCNFTYTCNVNL